MSVNIFVSVLLAAAQIGSINPALPPAASYDGEGMTIAVLDRGFYLEHEIFQLSDDNPRITKEVSDSLICESAAIEYAELPESLYVNSKIPFAFDYGDGDADLSQDSYDYHGTAMMSIAAGNYDFAETKHPLALEVAPEAQILAMKVYSDTFGYVTETAMCAAIEDSILFGADVILIGITDMYGFESSEKTANINATIDKAEAAGVIVVTAAGNAMNYGSGNVFDRYFSFGRPTTDQPDVGTTTWPGSIKSTLCVTSVIGNTLESDCFTLSDGSRIPYSDSNPRFEKTTGGKTFAEYFDDQTLEYVIADGLGKPEELAAAGNLNGKLAVINRGEITFVEKAANAAALGAVGVIVIDNETDIKSTLELNAELTGAPIPLIVVPSEAAKDLRSADSKYISIKSGETHLVKTQEKPSPYQYTAHGTTPELGLKPDIAAVGYEALCATRDGYAYMTSTTAAAAKVAGMCTLVKARLCDRFPEIDEYELMHLTKVSLVNSAEIMAPSYSSAYSPRIQGAGIVNLGSAMNAGILLTSNNTYKIELGDYHERTLTFEVTAHNFSDTKKFCRLEALIGSDDYNEISASELTVKDSEQPFYEQLGYDASDKISFILPFKAFDKAEITVDGEPNQINSESDNSSPFRFMLPSLTSRTFEFKITLDEETYNTYCEKFKNGFFIEGFIRLTAGKESASIPLVAFSGDFGAAPALDTDIYSGKSPIFEHTYLYRYSPDSFDSQMSILGKTVDGIPAKYDKNRMIFSPKAEGVNGVVMLNLSLLRAVYDVNITVSRDDEIISSTDYGNLSRTYLDMHTQTLVSPQLLVWDGRACDNSAYIYPDGDYTVTVSYRPIGTEEKQSFSYNLILDSTPPALDAHEFIVEGSKALLRVDIRDDFFTSGVTVCDSNNCCAELRSDGKWDISELTGKYIYIDITDDAHNSTVIRFDNPLYAESAD